MINIGPTVPPGMTKKMVEKTKTHTVTEPISGQLPQKTRDWKVERRKHGDRRQRQDAQLLDTRSGGDRRSDRRNHDPDGCPHIDTNV